MSNSIRSIQAVRTQTPEATLLPKQSRVETSIPQNQGNVSISEPAKKASADSAKRNAGSGADHKRDKR